MTNLVLTPHAGQLDVINSRAKISLLRAGRRWGKTKVGQFLAILWSFNWEDMVKRRGFEPQPWADGFEPVNLITMPTAFMARQIWFEPLYAMLVNHPLVDGINKQSMTFRFKGKRPDLLIRGANDSNGDRLRGLKILLLLMDELQNIRQPVIDRVLLPATSDLAYSQIYGLFTPMGKHNTAYRLTQRDNGNPARQLNFHYKTQSNPYFPIDELEEYRLILPAPVYREEYEATWEDTPGAFFTELTEDNLVDEFPPHWEECIIGVDHGELNPAHIVVVRYKDTWFFVDGWQPNRANVTDSEGHQFKGQPVPVYQQNKSLVQLAKSWNATETRCDPSRSARIFDIRLLGKDQGLRGLQTAVSGYNKVADGISQVHNLIARRKLLFYKGAHRSVVANSLDGQTMYDLMKSYHRKINLSGEVLDEEAPGQDCHAIDAIRYALARPASL